MFSSWRGKSRPSLRGNHSQFSCMSWNGGEKECLLLALIGSFPPCVSRRCISKAAWTETSYELKRLTVLHCFQIKGEKTSSAFFGWIYPSVTYWEACKHALIQFLVNYFAFIVLKKKKNLLLWHNWHRESCSYLVYDFGGECASLVAQMIKNLPAMWET